MSKPDHVGDRMAAAMRMAGLTYAERCVLAMLAYHDAPPYGSIPSAARIGKEIGGMHERNVRKVIKALVEKGLVKATKRQRTSRYMVDYAAAPPAPVSDRAVCARSENPDRAVSDSLTGRFAPILTGRSAPGKQAVEQAALSRQPRAGARGRSAVDRAMAALKAEGIE